MLIFIEQSENRKKYAKCVAFKTIQNWISCRINKSQNSFFLFSFVLIKQIFFYSNEIHEINIQLTFLSFIDINFGAVFFKHFHLVDPSVSMQAVPGTATQVSR